MQSFVATDSNTFFGDDCCNQWSRVFLGRIDVALTSPEELSCIEGEKDFPEQRGPRIALSYRIRKHFPNQDIHDRVAKSERQFPIVIPMSKRQCDCIEFLRLHFA